jgi:hypothetical protein
VSPFIEPETLKKVQWVYASDPAELRRNFGVEVSTFGRCEPCRWPLQPPYLHSMSCIFTAMPQAPVWCTSVSGSAVLFLQLLPEAFGGSAKPAPAQKAEGSYTAANGCRAEAVSA